MKLALRPETALERLALVTRRVPIPLVHALGGTLLARTVMVATRLGLFEALQATELTAVELAGRLATVRPNGRPHVTTIAAVWLDNALHFVTGKSERKAKNLARNSQCVITTGCHVLRGLDVVLEG
jgi:hypothetical protein